MDMDAAGTLDFGTFMTKFGTCLNGECPKLWVFGYGSLLWKPGFEYNSYKVGYVENYERKFNQGNETFRGTTEKPGRVANLEEKEGSKVWGVAFEICGRDEVKEVLRNLYEREIAGGSYKVTMTSFHPRKCVSINNGPGRIGNSAKCCSQTHHNIPLPHPPCGLSKSPCNPTTQACCLSKPHHPSQSSQSSPASLSLSWWISYLPTCPINAESDIDCPCFAKRNSEPAGIRLTRQSSSSRSKSRQNRDSRRHSQNTTTTNENSSPLEKSEKTLSSRKASLDFENHTKLNKNSNNSHHKTDSSHSIDMHNLTLEEQPRCCNLLPQNDATAESTTRGFSQTTTAGAPRRSPLVERDPNVMTMTTKSRGDQILSPDAHTDPAAPIEVLLFTVTKENALYMGSDEVETMASQIIETGGVAGTNVEYVLRICDFIKTFIPEDDDEHLFHLDNKIREKLRRQARVEGDTEQLEALQRWDQDLAAWRVNS